MNSLQIDILNPKASKLLKNLADLNLIAIRNIEEDGFLDIINKIRSKTLDNPPTLDEITQEVELVRASRYENSKG